MENSRISVVQGPTLSEGSIDTVVGVMPAEVLIRHYFVPERDVVGKVGYQRTPTQKRIRDLASGIANDRVDLPTSVLLSLRGERARETLTQVDPDSCERALVLDPEKAKEEHRLFVVDGQHRVRALAQAVDDGFEKILYLGIPFVCMIGADEAHEMAQFHVVNANAKSVPTDLAFELLRARAQADPSFEKYIVQFRGQQWELDAQGLTEHLEDSSAIWKGRIRFANSKKVKTTVRSANFIKSLKPLLTQAGVFRRMPLTKRGRVIDAYWRAICHALPEAFKDPSEFNIQKGIGVSVMHSVLPSFLEQIQASGDSVYDEDSYRGLVSEALNPLDGVNGNNESVSGVKFWRTGRDGAAGIYSSAAGRRRLAERIEANLPELEI